MELKLKYLVKIYLLFILPVVISKSGFADYNLEEDKRKQIYVIEDQISRLTEMIELNLTKLSLYDIELEKINNEVTLLAELISSSDDSTIYKLEFIESEKTDLEKYQENLEKLKESYKNKIIWLYKNGPNIEKEILFTSENIGNFYSRLMYLNRISEIRKRDLDRIVKNDFILREKKKLDMLRKTEKLRYITAKREDQIVLLDKVTTMELEMKNLSELNEEYNRVIARKQHEISRINRRIQFMREPFVYKINQTVDYSSDDFDALKGRLILPVNSVDMINDFGTFINPETFTESYSNGITVSIVKNSEVKAVADGIVEDINFIPKIGKLIIIKHNSGYRTMYGTLEPVTVHKGSEVKAGEVIGRTSISSNGQSFHFELWKDKVALDPKFWFRRG